MPPYSHLLVLVDLAPDSNQVLARAKQVASDATLTMLHVVEYVPVEPMGESMLPALQIEAELKQRATDRLRQLADAHQLSHCTQLVIIGSIKAETWRLAQELKCDLIVVGNHERHGLKALMNFTEDAILHIAPCDVLAVHLA
jgi:universal stress protein A